MKNKYIIGALLIGIISLFASCSDDNDSNPTLIQPKEFTLNTPEYANATTIDLENLLVLSLHGHSLSTQQTMPQSTQLTRYRYLQPTASQFLLMKLLQTRVAKRCQTTLFLATPHRNVIFLPLQKKWTRHW